MYRFFKFLALGLVPVISLSLASCGDDSNEPAATPTPDPIPPTTAIKVDPRSVFTHGLPLQVCDMRITQNTEGLVTKIVDEENITTFDYRGSSEARSRDAVNIPADYDMTFVVKSEDPDDSEEFTYYAKLTEQGFIKYAYQVTTEDGEDPAVDEWWFKYNELGQMTEMKRSEGDNEVTTIIYNAAGDITTVKVKDDIDGEKETTTILYTDDAHTTPVDNTSGMMLYDYTFRIDMDEMAPAYFAGLLGKGTAHLPLSAKSVYATDEGTWHSSYTYSWDLSASGMPIKFTSVQEYEWGTETDTFTFRW